MAVGYADGAIILYDLRDNRAVQARPAGTEKDSQISALAFSSDGRSIAWGAESGACGLLRGGS